uniref:Maturase K n=1 Tax=Adiantum reniforme var. sinense TaxID=269174 RepID=A0A7M3UJ40_9MONI|nr:maturase K [Adiantum reniforme var. sinense]
MATKVNYGSAAKLQINRQFSISKDCFLHPLLILSEEDFFLTGSKGRSHGVDVESVFRAWSTVAVKRLINSVRDSDSNYLDAINLVFVRNQTDELDAVDLYVHPLLEMIRLILGIALFPQIGSITSSRSKMSQSIHSIFLFLEDRFPRSHRILEADLPQNLHLETPIRLFRRQIKDVSFPHLLRIVFRRYKIFYGKTIHSSEGEQRGSVDTPIRNFYNFEIDLLILISWKQVCKSPINYFPPIDNCNILRKERYLSAYESKLDKLSINSYFMQSLCIHYGRWRNKFLMVSKGTCYFVKKWRYYFRTLLKNHFHYRTDFFIDPWPKILSTSCVSSLGYTLVARLVPKKVRIETVMGLYISILAGKTFYPKIPNSIITKTLAKQKFCDISGRPAGKSAWITSTDDKILDGYVQLCQVFFLYYGASTNPHRLRRLRYVLQISCDNTLAGKHRSTKRLLQCKSNLETLNQIYISGKSESSSNQRVWRSTSIRSVLVEFATLEMGL